MNPKVDFYFDKETKWQAEIRELRAICLDCNLTEELKWGTPCYVVDGDKNVVLIHVFKEYCALLFFKGALLKDTDNILIQQTERVQSQRQIRFTNLQQVTDLRAAIKAYIFQAIEVEKAGLKVALKKTEDFPVADEFQQKLDAMPALKTSFEALTPGRQRAYLLYFTAPKQAKTREARVEKCIPDILQGKGLMDGK
ncbi:YdeI/OmpD-associated family protein [Mucilaginibacter myungsuensis]|uniref:YdeI/OmpD-associated family protein n=1 Tax=Mucilaginibacter myungsuensis TaxID=649104 RepID=A0A929L113_9SPHI|nr:DUF1801 domain-containing protein [Mucilaginibacter myungsuensis]MBE9662145.1 YdeI/OmpD-associated family protein [Mucilaginibacter myungsuensis]MDN3599421.1 YdeI/OmpD-associated family protein [Mucilaginibacter myungsuensis]